MPETAQVSSGRAPRVAGRSPRPILCRSRHAVRRTRTDKPGGRLLPTQVALWLPRRLNKCWLETCVASTEQRVRRKNTQQSHYRRQKRVVASRHYCRADDNRIRECSCNVFLTLPSRPDIGGCRAGVGTDSGYLDVSYSAGISCGGCQSRGGLDMDPFERDVAMLGIEADCVDDRARA